MAPRIVPTREIALSREFGTRAEPLRADREIQAHIAPLDEPRPAVRDAFHTRVPTTSKTPLDKITARTHKLAFSKPVIPKVRALKLSEKKSVKGHELELRAKRKIETSYSKMLDAKPITLDMIDLKYMPFPDISEIIRTMAEKNEVAYSQVKLIGIFVPIPVELVKSTHIDSFAGKLSLSLRQRTGKAKPRCVRIAFGRLRTNDKIVQCVLPLN